MIVTLIYDILKEQQKNHGYILEHSNKLIIINLLNYIIFLFNYILFISNIITSNCKLRPN